MNPTTPADAARSSGLFRLRVCRPAELRAVVHGVLAVSFPPRLFRHPGRGGGTQFAPVTFTGPARPAKCRPLLRRELVMATSIKTDRGHVQWASELNLLAGIWLFLSAFTV